MRHHFRYPLDQASVEATKGRLGEGPCEGTRKRLLLYRRATLMVAKHLYRRRHGTILRLICLFFRVGRKDLRLVMHNLRLQRNKLIHRTHVRRNANKDGNFPPHLFNLPKSNGLLIRRRRNVMDVNCPNGRLNARNLTVILALHVRHLQLFLNVTRTTRGVRLPANDGKRQVNLYNLITIGTTRHTLQHGNGKKRRNGLYKRRNDFNFLRTRLYQLMINVILRPLSSRYLRV